MIAADSSAVIAWLARVEHPAVNLFQTQWLSKQLAMPPVVLAEVVSSRHMSDEQAEGLADMLLLPVTDGYWWRAGRLRSRVLRAGRKAKLADALVAQACIDAALRLLTLDSDFEAFALLGGLKLVET